MDAIGRMHPPVQASKDEAVNEPRHTANAGLVGRDWMATLRDACAYRNDDVVSRFCGQFAVSREAAEALLVETMKWLWLCEYNRQCNAAPVSLRIDPPLRIIDEMWHNLIVHTRDYAALCRRYFGAFVHHLPTPRREHAEHEQLRASMPEAGFLAMMIERSRPQYTLVYDLLGVDTFRTWYVVYPRQYTAEAIKALRR